MVFNVKYRVSQYYVSELREGGGGVRVDPDDSESHSNAGSEMIS